MNTKLASLTLISAIVVLSSSAHAQTAFAVDTGENLYSINLPTATATLIGNTGQFLEGLAYDQGSGKLFGTDSSGNLYSVNPSTAASALVGSTGLGNIEGLSFTSPNGVLFGTDFQAQTGFDILDQNTAAQTLFTTTDQQVGPTRAMCFNPTATLAYIVGDQPNLQTLWSVTPGGISTQIGGLSNFTAAIDYSGGSYWSLGTSGEVYQLDVTTGAQTLVGNTGGQFWLDMSASSGAAVTPEPATMVALGLGALATLRKRRKSN